MLNDLLQYTFSKDVQVANADATKKICKITITDVELSMKATWNRY